MVSGSAALGGVRLLYADIEERCLFGSMLPQFGELVDATGSRLLLFSLIPALCFVALFLLSFVFFLTLGKC